MRLLLKNIIRAKHRNSRRVSTAWVRLKLMISSSKVGAIGIMLIEVTVIVVVKLTTDVANDSQVVKRFDYF